MAKIYEKYSDLHVSGVMVYKKTADAYAYSDSNKTVKIDAASLKDLFEKGVMIIVDGDVEYKPVSFSIVETVGTVTYVKTDDTTATTAVLATLVSSEYVAG